MDEQENTFPGFQSPKENWSKLPHQLIEALPDITSQGELMVILYILRHTWGYREYGQPKKITLDEFMHGRKTKNLKDYPTGRMDNGVGMSKDAILRGLKRAEKHGFIEIDIDDSDKARIKKYYVLRMSESQTPDLDVRKSDPEVPESDSQVRESDSNGKDFGHRSEKDTFERNSQKEREKENADFPKTPAPASPDPGGGIDSGKERGDDNSRHSGYNIAGDIDVVAGGPDRAVGDPQKEIDDEHEQETSGNHPVGPGERFGDLGIHDGEPVEVDREANARPAGCSIGGDHRPDPTTLDLARRTAAARAEAGNWADPASFALGDRLITVACARMGRSEPQGKKRDNAVAFFKKALKTEGLLQGDEDMLERAVKDWLDPEGEYAFFLPQYELTTKHELALRHFGIVLSKAKAQTAKPDRRARDVEAMEASLASFEERMAARSPPEEGPDQMPWTLTLHTLEAQVGQATFFTYYRDTRLLSLDDGMAVIQARDGPARDFLQARAKAIGRELSQVLGRAVEVRFEVRE